MAQRRATSFGTPARAALVPVVALALAGCAAPPPPPPPPPAETEVVYERAERRVDAERIARLGAEVERLRADLEHAEDALIAAESGLRGVHTRADAVSSLAEARIQVARAETAASWRTDAIEEARHKLAEADQQLREQRFGAAIFFASRAQRIARSLNDEARAIAATKGHQLVRGDRVNLREGPSTQHSVVEVLLRQTPVFVEKVENGWVLVRTPSGKVGWIYARLLQRP